MNIKDRLKSLFWFVVLVLSSPLCFILIVLKLLRTLPPEDTQVLPKSERRRILVATYYCAKGLHVARSLGKMGHHVIVVTPKDCWFAGIGWSKYIKRFCKAPIVSGETNLKSYVNTVIDIIKEEEIDWFVPVSKAFYSLPDTFVSQQLKKHFPHVKYSNIDEPNLTKLLDNKYEFLALCQQFDLDVPDFKFISTLYDICEMRKAGVFLKRHYFLKSNLTYSPNERNEFDRIPHEESELKTYFKRFERKCNFANNYFISEYIKGTEYGANVFAHDGEVKSIQIFPSSPTLLNYIEIEHAAIYKWVKRFISKLNLNGIICFDFMEDESTGKVYCIECNPRPHSALLSLRKPIEVDRAIRAVTDPVPNIDHTFESENKGEIYFLYHEMEKLLFQRKSFFNFLNSISKGYDGIWDSSDPVPFFLVCHFQLPILLWKAFIGGDRWEILNYNLGHLGILESVH